MFTPKTNSKQKRAKKTQERETGDAATVQLAVASKSTREASKHQRKHLLLASHSLWRVGTVLLREKLTFSPQNPNFDFPKLKFDPKVCLNISKHEKTLKIM